jgi:antitoxin PrlF
MSAILEAESTLTDRYQTTVPESIRQVLRLSKRDKLHYSLEDGKVVITRGESRSQEDPVMGAFLGFLAKDIVQRPERVKALDSEFADRLRALTHGVDVDLDAVLSPDDE